MTVFDTLIRGGWIVDGTGSPPFRGDLAVHHGRIAAIGQLTGAQAATVIDATGKYLFPGLIDAHAHAEGQLWDQTVWKALLRQGVTTLILGQDGLSYAPGSADTVEYVRRYFGSLNGPPPPTFANGGPVSKLLAGYEGLSPVNVGYLVPAGTVRFDVLGGANRAATTDELRSMRQAVEAALDDGALGLSTGLEYVPGVYADLAELVELCRPVASAGGVYVTHMRGYEAAARTAFAEVRAISEGSGVASHISHYRGPAHLLAQLVDDSRADGIDMTFDSYPYERSSTILAMRALPPDIQADGPESALARLKDPEVQARLDVLWSTPDSFLPDIVVAHAGSGQWSWAEGMTLRAVSDHNGQTITEVVLGLLIDGELEVSCVSGAGNTFSEEDIRQLARHEAQMGCSDAIYLGGHPHPRGYGAFARFLGEYTRVRGDWTWGEAAVHLAGHTARRFGLRDRGTLRQGCIADIAVVDPVEISDRASYDRPRDYAVGVDTVLVGGELVLVDGELTGATPGRALRRGE